MLHVLPLNLKPEKLEKFDGTKAWTQDDLLCRNYILNGLNDSLCNVLAPVRVRAVAWTAAHGPVLFGLGRAFIANPPTSISNRLQVHSHLCPTRDWLPNLPAGNRSGSPNRSVQMVL